MKSLLITFFTCLSFGAQSQFELPYELASPLDSPDELCVADFDGDLDKDIVVSAFHDSRIVLYKQISTGEFGAQQIISTAITNPVTVDFADLDGDSDFDVVAAGLGKIALITNNGSDWSSTILYTDATTSGLVRCHDLDSDLDEDIIFAKGNQLWWIENNGVSFNAAQLITVIPWIATELLVEDVDGDLDADILIGSLADDEIYLLTNNGLQVFSQTLITNTVNGLTYINVRDVDGDLDLDILTAAHIDNQLSWFENLGGGLFGSEIVIASPSDPTFIDITDIDGDSDMDVVATGGITNLCWVENLGGTTFNAGYTSITGPNYITEALYTDINNDSQKDFILVRENQDQLLWLENLNSGAFSPPVNIVTSVENCLSLDVGDVDNDGDIDVIASSYDLDELTLYKNVGIDSFERQVSLGTMIEARGIEFSEVNDDGLLDIVCISNTDGLFWLENLGGTYSTPQLISGASGEPRELSCEDLDNDGDDDIVVGYYSSDVIVWFERIGPGVFAPAQTITTQSNAINTLSVGDIDGDGYRDVFSVSYLDHKVAWYQNQGNGTFGPQIDLSTFPVPLAGAIGDLDMDGDIDVIYSNAYDKVYFIENLGNGVFDTDVQLFDTLAYGRLSIYDVNDDGMNDIIASSSPVHWYQNLGSMLFSLDTIPLNRGVSGFADIKPVDLDSDGDLELFLGGKALSFFSNSLFFNSQLNGCVFVDQNLNGLFDAGEAGIPNISLQSSPSSDYTISNQDGTFTLYFSDIIGNYQLGLDSIPSWSLVTDSLVYNFSVDSTDQVYANLCFGFAPDSTVHDVSIDLTGSPTQCDDTLSFWISISNTGTTNPSGVIEVNLDPSLTYLGSSFIEDSINGQNVYWNYSSLPYFSDTLINFQVLAPDFNSIGDTLESLLNVTIDSSGILMGVFNTSHSDILTCAYDPNDKVGVPWGVGSDGIIDINTEFLDYTIRFQNTGNDTADVVLISDQLDNNLDFSSMQLLSTSHSVQVTVSQSGEIVFLFDNIMLPDSNVNQPLSNGFVKFRISLLENLPAGTQIHNFAQIYFDNNPAVLTNTEVHTLLNSNCPQLLADIIYPSSYCPMEEVSAMVNDNSNTTSYLWEVPGEIIVDSTTFTWTPTSSGQFPMNVSASNQLCMSDTSVFFTVWAEQAPTYLDTLFICESDSTLIFGQYYNSNGSYFDTLSTINGCDSVIVQLLSVNSNPEVLLTSFPSDTICSQNGLVPLPAGSPSGGYYSGLGVAEPNFDPQQAGAGVHSISYHYEDANGCSDSVNTQITVDHCLSILSKNEKTLIVYPNPTNDILYINSDFQINGIKVFDLTNRLVLQKALSSSKFNEINLGSLSPGIYSLTAVTEVGQIIVKIRKN